MKGFAIMIMTVSCIVLYFTLPNAYAQNQTRTFMDCYTGNMNFFLLQMIFSPPEIKFNMTDLMSPEVKQYFSDACNFYHEKSGIWLSASDNELDRQIVSKYGNEFMQKVKTPDSIKERNEAYMQLNNKTD